MHETLRASSECASAPLPPLPKLVVAGAMVVLQQELFDQIDHSDRKTVTFRCPLKGAKHVAFLAL